MLPRFVNLMISIDSREGKCQLRLIQLRSYRKLSWDTYFGFISATDEGIRVYDMAVELTILLK